MVDDQLLKLGRQVWKSRYQPSKSKNKSIEIRTVRVPNDHCAGT